MSQQVVARLPADLVEKIDEYAHSQSTPVRRVTRTDAVRYLLTEALKSEAVKPAGVAT